MQVGQADGTVEDEIVLSGSSVTVPITLINSVAIRDTGLYYSPPQKSNGLPYKSLRVNNTLDQAIELVLEVSRDGGSTWQYGGQLTASHPANVTIPYGRSKEALTAPWPDWRLRVKAAVAPLSGSVDIWGIQHAN